MTFWDAGELIAAAHSLGIPHPPGTPLYVALGHAWIDATRGVLGAARAMNALSAMATSVAGGLTAWLVARRVGGATGSWSGIVSALCAGTMVSVWSNATETEVYAVSLVHSVAMLASASMTQRGSASAQQRWLGLTAYLMALAPAVHLSALVAAPAAIVLASRMDSPEDGRTWRLERVGWLSGVLIAAAGVGRADWRIALAGLLVLALVALRGRHVREVVYAIALVAIGASALLMLLVRARHDPSINQGNPSTLSALADVVARRQYAVAPLLPRQAPVWWQAVNVLQYVDWQIAMSWGAGLMTSPLRVLAALAWIGLALLGHRALRRDAPSLHACVVTLLVCGTIGVAAYLNLKIGASLGWGFVSPGTIHEARERDYFFVLGFWAWGMLAGYGAVWVARSRGMRPMAGLAAALLPIAGNWTSADRAHSAGRSAAREVAVALLENSPRNAVLFLDGDNDSYPLWYLQEVEGRRRDVLPVTVPLLPAAWYPAEIARRTGWRLEPPSSVVRARTSMEQQMAVIAAAARRDGRPIAASPGIAWRERALLGADWVMVGPVYIAGSAAAEDDRPARIDSASAVRWLARAPVPGHAGTPPGDDVGWAMLSLLQCPRLAVAGLDSARRDSLELRCNLR